MCDLFSCRLLKSALRTHSVEKSYYCVPDTHVFICLAFDYYAVQKETLLMNFITASVFKIVI